MRSERHLCIGIFVVKREFTVDLQWANLRQRFSNAMQSEVK